MTIMSDPARKDTDVGIPTLGPNHSPLTTHHSRTEPLTNRTTHEPTLVEELPLSLTPWDIFLRLQGLSHVLFLDSALAHPHLGRYSFLSADPYDWIWARGNTVYAGAAGQRLPQTDPF